jgi:hypothetical protein
MRAGDCAVHGQRGPGHQLADVLIAAGGAQVPDREQPVLTPVEEGAGLTTATHGISCLG